MTDAAPAESDAATRHDPAPDPAPDPALDGLRYADAMAELDAILHELERGDVDLDRLAGQVRRAADLVRFCRGRLDDTRTEVTRIVTDLDTGLGSGPDAGLGSGPDTGLDSGDRAAP